MSSFDRITYGFFNYYRHNFKPRVCYLNYVFQKIITFDLLFNDFSNIESENFRSVNYSFDGSNQFFDIFFKTWFFFGKMN
jgi:hypothetical protein